MIGMIVGTLRILPLPERRAEVLEIFQAIQGPVLAQPGCVACTIEEKRLQLITMVSPMSFLKSGMASSAHVAGVSSPDRTQNPAQTERSWRMKRLIATSVILFGLVPGAAAATEPTRPASSCVACHTDVEKLKTEAAKLPPPPKSAMTAGKG